MSRALLLKPFVLIVALGVLAPLPSCSSDSRPDILLVTIDTLRADHVGCYGYDGVETPVLDGLAGRGALFTEAFAHVPQTLPSHASILSGQLPFEHGVRLNINFSFPDDAPTLAAILRRAGYRTGAVIASWVLDDRFGLARGFDAYDDPKGLSGERRAEEVTRRGGDWLSQRNDDDPFFLWVHYYDPHGAYAPPSPFKESYADAPYDGEIAYTDMHLGILLNRIAALNRSRPTLIVVTSDHGEGLMDHGELVHSYLIYDTVMRVPLIIVPPGETAHPVRIDEQVGSIDLAPTILAYAGIEAPPSMRGENLKPAIEGRRQLPEARSIYLEAYAPHYNYKWSRLLGLRKNGKKLIIAPTPELYDLKSDPGESVNLYDPEGPAAALEAELSTLLAEASKRSRAAPQQLAPDMEQQLLALGYVSSSETEPAVESLESEGPDPKEMIPVANAIAESQFLMSLNRYRESIGELEKVRHRDPKNLVLLQLLALSRDRAGDLDEAVAAYHQLFDVNPQSALALNNLALIEERRGRMTDSLRLLERSREVNPQFFEAANNLARVRSRMGDLEAAEALYREAMRLRPESPVPHLNLGNVYIRMNQPELAAREFREAISLGGDPEVISKARNNLLFLAQQQR